MIRTRQIGLVLAAAASLVLAAMPAHADPGGPMGKGAHAQTQGQGQHAQMQERMSQRMTQHQGEHARGPQGGAAQGGCPMMTAQAGTQGEHKH